MDVSVEFAASGPGALMESLDDALNDHHSGDFAHPGAAQARNIPGGGANRRPNPATARPQAMTYAGVAASPPRHPRFNPALMTGSVTQPLLPDVLSGEQLTSLSLTAEGESQLAFKLLDEDENLVVGDKEEFARRLGCEVTAKVKVISIVGNTGEGKSHTLNHALFDGEPVFSTSAKQESCTIGVWVAFQPIQQLVVLDTEGR